MKKRGHPGRSGGPRPENMAKKPFSDRFASRLTREDWDLWYQKTRARRYRQTFVLTDLTARQLAELCYFGGNTVSKQIRAMIASDHARLKVLVALLHEGEISEEVFNRFLRMDDPKEFEKS